MNLATGLDKIFRPRSIAVIGATSRPGSIGRVMMHNLLTYEFQGTVFPVNPNASVIHSIKCYPSICDVPDDVDLAIIIVRKQLVLQTIRQCGEKGVGGVVVITAGFRETGPDGARAEQEILACVREHGMRMVGPNCFGVINTDPAVTMNATFSRTVPLPGKIGFMSQSGALGEAILSHARNLGIGFSMFASVGNKADTSGNTLLEYWKDDPATEIILLYLESFGDPETFTRIARSITRHKPIIAVKSGRSVAGARAAISHTGALAGGDLGVDALFEQCGVLRVASMEELFDLAKAFDQQPPPHGKRVAILTNAGGPGILATDAAAGLGLEIVSLSEATTETLKAHLPAEASTTNPVDMIASATAAQYRMALDALFADPAVDAVICIFVAVVLIDESAVADAIIAARAATDKPILTCFLGLGETSQGTERLRSAGIPVYTFPEEMAYVFSRMSRYDAWQHRPLRTAVAIPDRVTRAKQAIRTRWEDGSRIILGGDALECLDLAGIPTAQLFVATDCAHAETLAAEAGYPVVLKLEAADLAHKTEIGGVVTDIRNVEELRKQYDDLMQRANNHALAEARIVVQAMITGCVEMAIGMSRDPQFGPLIMCGLGGIHVEVVRDFAFRLPPLTAEDAVEMIESLKGAKLLRGYRGAPAADWEPLISGLVTLSQLAMDFPILQELDINPFMACPKGMRSCAIDARLVLSD